MYVTCYVTDVHEHNMVARASRCAFDITAGPLYPESIVASLRSRARAREELDETVERRVTFVLSGGCISPHLTSA